EKSPPRAVPRLDKLSRAELVQQLESPNGHVRDLAQRLIVERQDKECVPLLEKMAKESKSPLGRLHSLCALDRIGAITSEVVAARLSDGDAGVRRHAARLTETAGVNLKGQLREIAQDPDAQVRLQIACSLATSRGDPAHQSSVEALAVMALTNQNDTYIGAATLSSVTPDNAVALFTVVMKFSNPSEDFMGKLVATLVGVGGREELALAVVNLAKADANSPEPWQFSALGVLVEALRKNRKAWMAVVDGNFDNSATNLRRWATTAR